MDLSLPRHLNKGSALIMALFIMALVAIATTAMTYRLQSDVSRMQLIADSTQLSNALDEIRFWAESLLIKSAATHPDPNNSIEALPQKFAEKVVNGSIISGELEDAQGRYNLNNLELKDTSPKTTQDHLREIARFSHFLENLLPELDKSSAFGLAAEISNGIRAPRHMDLMVARRGLPSKNFAHVSELKNLKSLTPDHYKKIEPYLTALPEVTPINLNSAPPQVLQMVFPKASLQSLEQLSVMRKQRPFHNIDALKNSANAAGVSLEGLIDGSYTLQSHHFWVMSRGTHGKIKTHLEVLMKRKTKKDKKPKIIVIYSHYS